MLAKAFSRLSIGYLMAAAAFSVMGCAGLLFPQEPDPLTTVAKVTTEQATLKMTACDDDLDPVYKQVRQLPSRARRKLMRPMIAPCEANSLSNECIQAEISFAGNVDEIFNTDYAPAVARDCQAAAQNFNTAIDAIKDKGALR